MVDIIALRGQRADLVNRAREILHKAEAENRDLMASEQREWDKIDTDVVELTNRITRAEDQRDREMKMIEAAVNAGEGHGAADAIEDRVTAQTVALRPEQRVADVIEARNLARPGDEQLDLYRFLAGVASGRWDGADNERRAMSEGTLTAGGHTVPIPLAGQVIDLARNKAQVFRAGAITVPMDREQLKVAKLTGDPTAAWKAENAAGSASDATLDVVTFSARTLFAGPVLASQELVQDSIGLGEVLANSFAELLAVELDRVALFGSGTGEEPLGLRTTANVNEVSMGVNGAAIADHDKLLDAYELIWSDNHEPNGAFIMAPRTARVIAGFKDTTNQPLRRPDELEDARFLKSKNVGIAETQGTSGNASSIFCGDWSNLMVGIRLGATILPLNERYADAYQVGFVAALRADIQVRHAEAFARIIGIIP